MPQSKEQQRAFIDTVLYQHKKHVWFVGQNGLVEMTKLGRESYLNRPVFIMQDHDGAGRVWDAAYYHGVIPQGSTLVHVDAHDDLSLPDYLPTTLEELGKHDYNVGDFILPRVNVGIVSNIVWIKPPKRAFWRAWYETHAEWRLSHKPKIEVSDYVPEMNADILDIDLDFFTDDINNPVPDFFLQRNATKFLSKLMEKVSGVKIITIATSPGYIQMNRERPLLEAALEVLLE